MNNNDYALNNFLFFNKNKGTSIETGYFVFTLMPSLFCHLSCPHCYLSKDQRSDTTILSVENLKNICKKIDSYWNISGVKNRVVVCYWYGGEPTSMGLELFTDMINNINMIFNKENGYYIKHVVLTSLVSMKEEWFDFFNKYCEGEFQTSYDGLMRGEKYLNKWDKKVRLAVSNGLKISTISVINNELLKFGAKNTLDYLSNLGVKETGWKPFMLNFQNKNKTYDQFAPTMDNFSKYMIEISQYWLDKKKNNLYVPELGSIRFMYDQMNNGNYGANIAGQTLFLLPNGDFVLPDYKDGLIEYMEPFGNILEQDFVDILKSDSRKKYLRKQVLRNNNQECFSCDHFDKCHMEFWKYNNLEDDCFGAKKYVDWFVKNISDFDFYLKSDFTLLA